MQGIAGWHVDFCECVFQTIQYLCALIAPSLLLDYELEADV